jgi:HNH endonuclease
MRGTAGLALLLAQVVKNWNHDWDVPVDVNDAVGLLKDPFDFGGNRDLVFAVRPIDFGDKRFQNWRARRNFRRLDARAARGGAGVCMNSIRSRRPRLKLDCVSYRALCRKVLERDGWKSQQCGSVTNLQIDHLRFRSALGDDDLDNLITLCSDCHPMIHHR